MAVIVGAPAYGRRYDKRNVKMSLLMVTGPPGGAFYHVGLGMASLWTTKLKPVGVRVSAAVSEGSSENIEAIGIADADLILVDSVLAGMAYSGRGDYKGRQIKELRSIANLWPSALHIIARTDEAKTESLGDLQGLTVAEGLPRYLRTITESMILKSLDPENGQAQVRSMSPQAAVEAIKQKTVDVAAITGGVPVPMVSELFHRQAGDLRLLGVTDSLWNGLRDQDRRMVFRKIIAPGTYQGQDEPVPTLAHMNLLAVTSSLNSEVVYALTKILFDNADYLARLHPACRSIAPERAVERLTVPLHAGALKYYEEREIPVPKRLLPSSEERRK